MPTTYTVFQVAALLKTGDVNEISKEVYTSNFKFWNIYSFVALPIILLYNILSPGDALLYASTIIGLVGTIVCRRLLAKEKPVNYLLAVNYLLTNWAVPVCMRAANDNEERGFAIFVTIIFFLTNTFVMQRVLMLEKYYIFLLIWIFEGYVWSAEIEIFIWTVVILIIMGFIKCRLVNLSKNAANKDKNFDKLQSGNKNQHHTDGENSARDGNKLEVSIGEHPIIKIQNLTPEDNLPVQRQLNFNQGNDHPADDIGVIDKIYGGLEDDKNDHYAPHIDEGEKHDGNNFIVPVFNSGVQITEEEIPNPFDKIRKKQNQRVISENTEGDAGPEDIEIDIRNNIRAAMGKSPAGDSGEKNRAKEGDAQKSDEKKSPSQHVDFFPDKVPDHKPFLLDDPSHDHDEEKHDDLLNPDEQDAIGNIYGNDNPFDETEKPQGGTFERTTKQELDNNHGFGDFEIPKNAGNPFSNFGQGTTHEVVHQDQ